MLLFFVNPAEVIFTMDTTNNIFVLEETNDQVREEYMIPRSWSERVFITDISITRVYYDGPRVKDAKTEVRLTYTETPNKPSRLKSIYFILLERPKHGKRRSRNETERN